MSDYPTASMTFGDLILHVAEKIGVAYYGATGTGAAVVPTDAYDLAQCKKHVNNAVRWLIRKAPMGGWNWQKPVATVALWPSVAKSADPDDEDAVLATGTYSALTSLTTITASVASFYPSMENKTITIYDDDDDDTSADSTIFSYTSSTVVTVSGDVSWVGNKTFAVEADGSYTLPKSFGGTYLSDLSFAAGTSSGGIIEWGAPLQIRRRRENMDSDTGTPYVAAIRRQADYPRRWELMVFPTPSELVSVEFTYALYFDAMTTTTEYPPAGSEFDDVLRAACDAVIERDVEDTYGASVQYFETVAIADAVRINGGSSPKRLGYCGNPGRSRRRSRTRDDVSFTEGVYHKD